MAGKVVEVAEIMVEDPAEEQEVLAMVAMAPLVMEAVPLVEPLGLEVAVEQEVLEVLATPLMAAPALFAVAVEAAGELIQIKRFQ